MIGYCGILLALTVAGSGDVALRDQLLDVAARQAGHVGDEAIYSTLGCIGHGVSLTHLNGKTLADLVCERKTDLTDVWFVNRKLIPWPPEPVRFVVSQAIRGYLRVEDRFYDPSTSF